jgi:hypothetical protein
MSRRNKHRHDNRSNNSDDNDDDGEYNDGGNNTRGRDRMENDLLWAQCHELEKFVKSLRMEIRMKKSLSRQTKRQIRNGEEANLSDKVLELVKVYLIP